MKRGDFTYITEKPVIEPIGFMLQGDNVIVANPCTIPIEFLEDAIKQHRARKNNKTEVSVFCMLAFPFPPKLFKKRR